MLKYSVNIVWSEEDDAFLATIPEFPGLSAFGETHQEAIQEALTAAEGMIEVMQQDNEKIPKPNTKEIINKQKELNYNTKQAHI